MRCPKCHPILSVLLVVSVCVVCAYAEPVASPSQFADTEASAVQPKLPTVTEWKTFPEEFHGKPASAEARIAAVDAWIASNPEVARARSPIANVAGSSRADFTPRRLPAGNSGDPKQDALESAIADEFAPILSARVSPEERIRQIDKALERTKELRKALDDTQRANAQQKFREGGANVPDAESRRPSFPDTPTGRLEAELFRKSSELMTRTKGLSPEQRIAAIDAALPDIKKVQTDLHVLKSQEISSPNHP